ncbi:ApaG protein [Acetobacter estunensis NRIC 0472]|uniref:Protein ApaG n=1 Tax=Acetobacter estunensis TaxID=104097 RepID=A0A967B4V6_9PROT|nr:Co2+/Mg2+ efflux protein ApaG [Acetobacter estunensis]MBV1835838.1 Co2+/Mg2+ efflux protein ApaG [Acetobacter estunensis]MBV1835901.1 Co2+/Mg2+ efflux protein ApaG [Acetobacter estunensis]NHO53234.1 Co2+/Mg2+ efflux protein ApaG [Acetobacter estunensis]GBQ23733.1 ApaG protein [Acetobacter estunensis NRIC 0472]
MSSRPPMPPKLFTDPEEALNEAIAALPAYEDTTENIHVVVRPFWLDDQSQPDEQSYCWGYRIRIENLGDHPVQLLERMWEIIDAQGQIERIRGEGVVGEQPLIEPGNAFEYTSGASLDTPSGIMRGSYRMEDATTGRHFDIRIPPFSLDCPYHAGLVH